MILVSACLYGCPCRYDGKGNAVRWVTELVNSGAAHLICPEQLGGLSTPRIPCEIQAENRVFSQTGLELTDAFVEGAQRAGLIAKALSCQKAILKSKSPSCGRDLIYNGEFTGKLTAGDGLTTQLFKRKGIKVYNENEAFDFYKSYDVIWFDLDETLMDFRKTQVIAFDGLCKFLGYSDSNDYARLNQIYESHNHPLWKRLEAGEIDMDYLRFNRIAGFLTEIGCELDPSLVVKHYETALAGGDFLLDGALNLVRELSKHYRLGLITNGIATVQKGRLGKSPITPYFEWITISEEAGMSKPDPRIFAYTAERMGISDKSRILMVGDSLASDIKGACAYGIDSCWLSGQSSNLPTYVVKSLSQLAAMLLPHPFNGLDGYSKLLKQLSDWTHNAFHLCSKSIAIDGYCGSGKTTLAGHLEQLLSANVVQIDHFYLPEASREVNWMAIPGGNIDFDRLIDEVLSPLSKGYPVRYRPYLCKEAILGEEILLEENRPLILEGSYSNHPKLASYINYKMFLKCNESVQHSRIHKRSSKETLERFKAIWIPLEHQYFNYFEIEGRADLVIET